MKFQGQIQDLENGLDHSCGFTKHIAICYDDRSRTT